MKKILTFYLAILTLIILGTSTVFADSVPAGIPKKEYKWAYDQGNIFGIGEGWRVEGVKNQIIYDTAYKQAYYIDGNGRVEKGNNTGLIASWNGKYIILDAAGNGKFTGWGKMSSSSAYQFIYDGILIKDCLVDSNNKFYTYGKRPTGTFYYVDSNGQLVTNKKNYKIHLDYYDIDKDGVCTIGKNNSLSNKIGLGGTSYWSNDILYYRNGTVASNVWANLEGNDIGSYSPAVRCYRTDSNGKMMTKDKAIKVGESYYEDEFGSGRYHKTTEQRYNELKNKKSTSKSETSNNNNNNKASSKQGWVQEGSNWCYYENGSKSKNKWIQDQGGKYYYVNSSGIMATNTIIDNKYYVDKDGVWVIGPKTITYNNTKYNIDKDGIATKSVENKNTNTNNNTTEQKQATETPKQTNNGNPAPSTPTQKTEAKKTEAPETPKNTATTTKEENKAVDSSKLDLTDEVKAARQEKLELAKQKAAEKAKSKTKSSTTTSKSSSSSKSKSESVEEADNETGLEIYQKSEVKTATKGLLKDGTQLVNGYWILESGTTYKLYEAGDNGKSKHVSSAGKTLDKINKYCSNNNINKPAEVGEPTIKVTFTDGTTDTKNRQSKTVQNKGLTIVAPECEFNAPQKTKPVFQYWKYGSDEYEPGDEIELKPNKSVYTIKAIWGKE